jgi:hypothetical protein
VTYSRSLSKPNVIPIQLHMFSDYSPPRIVVSKLSKANIKTSILAYLLLIGINRTNATLESITLIRLASQIFNHTVSSMKSPLLSLLLLLLPQELLGFVPVTVTAPMHKKTKTTKQPVSSFDHTAISHHHHHHHHFFANRQISSVGLTVLSAASESVSIIEQLTNPLLIQHVATGGYVRSFC